MWLRWLITVCSLMTRSSAISRLVLPCASWRRTSISRGVRPAGNEAMGTPSQAISARKRRPQAQRGHELARFPEQRLPFDGGRAEQLRSAQHDQGEIGHEPLQTGLPLSRRQVIQGQRSFPTKRRELRERASRQPPVVVARKRPQ